MKTRIVDHPGIGLMLIAVLIWHVSQGRATQQIRVTNLKKHLQRRVSYLQPTCRSALRLTGYDHRREDRNGPLSALAQRALLSRVAVTHHSTATFHSFERITIYGSITYGMNTTQDRQMRR
jgi:hypothetical protein